MRSAEFSNPLPSQNVLPDWLMRAAFQHPEKIAIEDGHQSWTFSELDRRATHLAQQLVTTGGVGTGDRVALLAANSLTYCVVVHALIRAGGVLVPLNTRLAEGELCWQINDIQASLLIHDDLHEVTANHVAAQIPGFRCFKISEVGLSELQQIPGASKLALRSEIDLGAPQAIIYTSGTTGQPKGVLITYGMHWWNAMGSLLNLGHRPDDCWLACLPFFHIGGLSILMRGAIYGMRVLVYDRFDAPSINQALLKRRVSIISVVTTMLQRLLTSLDQDIVDAGTYPPSLRCVLLGGGPAPQSLLEECARRGIPAVQTYGMTESCSQAATLAPEDARRKLGSSGRPLPAVQIRIMVNGRIAESDEPGEIMLRGPTITPGYALQPEATAAAFKEGWFATGDWGYLDREGYLYVLDRRSDLIISGGENIYPAEIEAALLEHPAVAEAGVCGVPDERWGQVPLAFVVLRGGFSAGKEEILAYLATRIARYKIPDDIRFAAQLPRTPSGKLLRRELPWRT